MKAGRPYRLWAAPLALGLISGIGLTAALLGEGWLDIVSWTALAVPVICCAWYSFSDRVN